MQVNRYGRQRRLPSKLFMLLGLVLIAGVSLGGAFLWQTTAPSPDSGRALPAITPVREELAYPPVRPPAQATEPAAPAVQPPEFTPGPFAVDWQLPLSEPVDVSYFDGAIFFGDSLITGFAAHRLLPNATVIAIIGVTPQTALEEPLIPTDYGMATMLEATQEKEEPPGKVYIMLGSHSLGLDAEQFASYYRQFIDAVRAQHPGATIYIMSLPPVAAHVREHHHGVSREKVVELNGVIAELARAAGLPFLNVFDALAGEDGYLPAHASSDGLHLSAEYNFVLLDFLKAHTVR